MRWLDENCYLPQTETWHAASKHMAGFLLVGNLRTVVISRAKQLNTSRNSTAL